MNRQNESNEIKPIGLNELREKFLTFFEQKEHLRMKSFSLIPQNDKSLLLINSGMAPLKPYFTGQETPPRKRVSTCQKCIRTNDIENVGITLRHGTFFEMLGNFSFGDYFKEEIIPWAWEFLTEVLEIPASRLYPSVYEDDDEAFDIWHEKVGIPKERIFRMGKDDNFWEVGLGPCGPCSEIYFDKGEKYGCGKEGCTVGCDCDRFMEVWNLVFTQFNKEEDGSYSRLKNPNIDTGMGLERIAAVMQSVDSLFDVDTIRQIIQHVCDIAKVKYNESNSSVSTNRKDVSIRVITDHIRAVTFMASDGILPSNEGKGYILRRLLRRASRHGRLLGIREPFLKALAQTVIDISKQAYPELAEKNDYVLKVISIEEERFHETLDAGTDYLKGYISELKEKKESVLGGKQAFKLYDTYGFPPELMQEMLAEEGLTMDEAGFKAEMEEQRSKGRAAREENTYMGADETVFNRLPQDMSTEFAGYNQTQCETKILAIIKDNEIVQEAKAGDRVTLILSKTTLYAESGGQKGDSGSITSKSGKVLVDDCIKAGSNKLAHIGLVESGTITTEDKNGENQAVAETNNKQRLSTCRNHTATHLLQKALRQVLGDHVHQAGSLVSAERLRFDFTHFAAMTYEEIQKVEREVNEKILEGLAVDTKECGIEEARKSGATALFGEKYGDLVRVVRVEEYSAELCGGTHVKNTAQIGSFKLLQETGVSAGVRRIEACTGYAALEYYQNNESLIEQVCDTVKSTPENLLQKLKTLTADNKALRNELDKVKAKSAGSAIDEIIQKAETVNDITLIVAQIDGLDMNALRQAGDRCRDKLQSGVAVLFSAFEDKVNIVSLVTEDCVKLGLNAGKIIKEAAEITGGGGGGRPNMAQAGGKDKTKIPQAIARVKEIVGGIK